MDKYSFLGSLHISFYDKLYNQYLENPDSIDTTWRSFFQGYEFTGFLVKTLSHIMHKI